jgi:hypothetical protein
MPTPNLRERSMRMPFKRTGTVICSLPSSNSRACSGAPDQPSRQLPRLNPAVLVEFATLRQRLLDDTTPDANAASQAPIAVSLSVFLANRLGRYMRHQTTSAAKENTQGRHYTL